MGAIQRKNIYRLLEICNEHSGEILPTSEKVLILFGYSTTTRLSGTYADSFIKTVSLGWELGSWILITYETSYIAREDLFWEHNGFYRRYFERERLWLYPRDPIPFWRLKEFGGKY